MKAGITGGIGPGIVIGSIDMAAIAEACRGGQSGQAHLVKALALNITRQGG